ncbi:MAG: DUF2785 domain-containing protein [Planctomycetota bacterium]|nr:DUF2785 domain-containing protein [Planctomycetota bacterium]
MRLTFVSLLLVLSSCASIEVDPAPVATRDWSAIAAAGTVPAGESAFELTLELSELLGSPDPVLRDDCAYGITANWVVRQKLLDPDELRELVRRWTANLERELGSKGDDSVLLRSFSALSLSLIAARDLQTPFLAEQEVRGLLEHALDYSAREQDLRDWDPKLGWIHSVAHTADLLKFLARNPHVDAAGLNQILDAVERRLATPMERGFSMGEDERLARTLAAVILRPEHDEVAFEAFLERLAETRSRARDAQPFAATNLAIAENISHTLRALHSLLAVVDNLPPHAQRARDATLRAFARS